MEILTPRTYCRKLCLALMTLVLLMPVAAVAAAENARQHKIEAAFLYNFFNYITWPGYKSPEALKDPTICVNAQDPVQPYLTYIQHKMESERKLTIRQLQDGEPIAGCKLLFTRNALPASQLSDDVLVVSDVNGSIDQGGMIELTEQGERLMMKINYSLLEENGFEASSRLLDLAQKIK